MHNLRTYLLAAATGLALASSAAPAEAACNLCRMRLRAPTTAVAPPTNLPPVLTSITIPMGAYTQFGKGNVRYSSPRLGLWTGGAVPTSWSASFGTCGNASHWTLSGTAGVVAEGGSAVTPTPSVAGDGAHLSSGTCEVNVTASNAYGTSNTAKLTLAVVPDAASIGDNTVNYPGGVFASPYTLAGFEAGTTAANRALILTPGIDLGTSGLSFNNQWTFGQNDAAYVTIKDADPARPSQLDKIQFTGGSYIKVQNLTLSSASRSAEYGARLYASGTQHLWITNVQAGTGINSFVQNLKGFILDGVTDVVGTNLSVYGQMGGLYVSSSSSNVTINGLKVRWFSERGIQVGTSTDVTINDYVIASPRRIPGSIVHIDAVQIEDLSEPVRLSLNRGMLLPADALNSTYQGVFYGSGADTTTVFHAQDLRVSGLFAVVNAPTGWGGPAGNSGASYLKNATFVKVNTGVNDGCVTPEGNGACWTTAGATVSMGNTNAARFTGTMTFSHLVTDDVVTIASGNGGSKDAATVKESNHGAVSMSNWFANASARATLEAIPFDTWYAMDLDTVVATYKAAYRAKLNGDLKVGSIYIGAFDDAGNWNAN